MCLLSFLWLVNLQKNFFVQDNLVLTLNNYLSLLLLQAASLWILISMFSHIFHSFSKNCIIHYLKQSFSKSFFAFFFLAVFISVHDFNQTFWLHLMTLYYFFNTNPYNASFRCLLITYYSLSCKLVTSFSVFLIFILSVKTGSHYEIHAIFLDIFPSIKCSILLSSL